MGSVGPPTIYSTPYLKAGIEGGQYFNWFYNDSDNRGRGLDPNGSDLQVSLPEGDRLAQARNPYSPGQEILANKQLRWCWNNHHQAVYATPARGMGSDGAAHGMGPQFKIDHDRWNMALPPATGDQSAERFFRSKIDGELHRLLVDLGSGQRARLSPATRRYYPSARASRQSMNTGTYDGNNETVGGLPMLNWNFCCVWNWDARPFPTFPTSKNSHGAMPEIGNKASGSTACAPSCRRPSRARNRRPGRLRNLPDLDDARLVDPPEAEVFRL